MRSKGLALGFLIIVLAACVGGYGAFRLARSRLEPSGRAWRPPTPTATFTAPTVAPLTPTAVVVPTPVAPTPTPVPSPTSTPTARPTPSPRPVPLTPAGPTATPTPTVLPLIYRFLPTGPVRHTVEGCPGQYIMGSVRDAQGNPLPDVRLRSTDPWGNEAFAITKSAPADLGRYDFPLFPPPDTPMTYEVVVVDPAGRPISPVVAVPHHHEGPDKEANCHWLDWQRID